MGIFDRFSFQQKSRLDHLLKNRNILGLANALANEDTCLEAAAALIKLGAGEPAEQLTSFIINKGLQIEASLRLRILEQMVKKPLREYAKAFTHLMLHGGASLQRVKYGLEALLNGRFDEIQEYRLSVEGLKKLLKASDGVYDGQILRDLIYAVLYDESKVRRQKAKALLLTCGVIHINDRDSFSVNRIVLLIKSAHGYDMMSGGNFFCDQIIDALIAGGHVGTLITILEDSEEDLGSYATHAQIIIAEGLKKITGQDFGQDPSRWKNWWKANKKRYESELKDR